jgi:pimeloyl-ACP methyl ester carboxylesterase
MLLTHKGEAKTLTTFMLIHGAYQGGWIWKPVAARLRAAGHVAFNPSLDGCGERAYQLRPGITTETQAQELADFLRCEDLKDVVVAGTSAGGMVMAALAERARDRVRRLAFVDALALMDGEKIRDIVTRPAPIVTDVATGPKREAMPDRLVANGVSPDLADWAAARFGLHPIAAFEQPVALKKFWSERWDASVVFCRHAENPGVAHQRRCADALGARWHELDTGHYPMLSAPDELVRILVDG